MLVVLAAVLLLRQLLIPVLLAALLTYLLHPIVLALSRRMRRGLAVILVYLTLVIVVVGASAGLGFAVSQQVFGLVVNLTALASDIPTWLERLDTLQITFGPWLLDMRTIDLEPILSSLAMSVRPLVSGAGGLLASAASATASTAGVVVAVVVLGSYMSMEAASIEDSMMGLVPEAYRTDFRRLLKESGQVWNAFLRGQLLLGLIVGVVVAVALTILRVRFSLVLGLIAGLLEFIPMFGPVLAGLIAVVVALFQPTNAWGFSPAVFGLVIAGLFVLIQQLENYVLVPRIVGHTLNLSPLWVLLGALAGGTLAGVLGLLLAAPALATLRLWLGYIYRKVVGLETWPRPALLPQPRRTGRSLWNRLQARLSSLRAGKGGRGRKRNS
jgi:predicted PurR-regulated permease PerM